MMNSPVSFMGNDPIRSQLQSWAFYAPEKEEEVFLPEHLPYGPFPVNNIKPYTVNSSEFDGEEEGFDFN